MSMNYDHLADFPQSPQSDGSNGATSHDTIKPKGAMVDRERMEEAVLYLAHTDAEYARAKAIYDNLCEQRKIIKAMAYDSADGKTATAKSEKVYLAPAYRKHIEKMKEAQLDFLTLQAKRSTEVIIIDVWRSLNAAQRQGVFI